MKKLVLLAAISAILFASCKKDNPVQTPEGLVFEFATVNKIENGLSKAGLYSSESKHKVSRVAVYAFKKNESGDFLYAKTFDQIVWPGVGESFYMYTVPATDVLPEGDYKFLAVGREATDAYALTIPDATTNFNAFTATLTRPVANNAIFSGSSEYTVGAAGGGRVMIQMQRQVAGVVGYFSNIPTAPINGITPELVTVVITGDNGTSRGNMTVNLTTGTGSNPAAGLNSVIALLLTGQATGMDGDVEVFAGNDLGSEGVQKLPNTQLAGSFVIPTTNIRMSVVVGRLNGSQLEFLKEWPVLLNGASTFDLIPNHYYSLGTKNNNGTTNGDNPINLNREESLTLSIRPDWDGIHDLVIE